MNMLAIPKKPSERWEWIKYQLRVRGSSLSALARDLEVTRNAVHNVARLPYPRVERALAAKLGLRPEELWPERYDAVGKPLRQRPNAALEKPHIRKCDSKVTFVNTHDSTCGMTLNGDVRAENIRGGQEQCRDDRRVGSDRRKSA